MVKKRRARLSEQSEREMLRGDVVADSEGGAPVLSYQRRRDWWWFIWLKWGTYTAGCFMSVDV
jgi:hypothetical protein